MNRLKVVLVLLGFVFLLCFTRLYNLEVTTRFTRDESQNLVDMHRIFVDREITLLGPIDKSKTIIYPSLTFYLLLPFAALGKFYPQSPAYGTAFFGVLTAGVIIWLIKKINTKLLIWVAILCILWFPLVEASRWAWNPHLVPFFSFLAIVFYLRSGKANKLLSGVLFGLSFHLHYLAVVSFAALAVINLVASFKNKKIGEALCLIFGFVLLILPFVYFDLRNPPGLFFGFFVKHNMVAVNASGEFSSFPESFAANLWLSVRYLTQNTYFAIVMAISVLALIIKDIKNAKQHLIYMVAALTQVAVISFLPGFENRYFLLGLPFFFTWLFIYRDKSVLKIQKIILVVLISGSVLALTSLLTTPNYPPGAYVVGQSTDFIKQAVEKNDLKNVNIAVLASPDRDPFGVIYRHTALVNEVRLLAEDQYEVSDHLFVVTTSGEDAVRGDPANLIDNFRRGKVIASYQVSGGDWRVYLFKRN